MKYFPNVSQVLIILLLLILIALNLCSGGDNSKRLEEEIKNAKSRIEFSMHTIDSSRIILEKVIKSFQQESLRLDSLGQTFNRNQLFFTQKLNMVQKKMGQLADSIQREEQQWKNLKENLLKIP